MAAPPRRNEPCPCGSGLRYKDCHGRLADAGAGAPDPERLVQQGLAHHREGRLDDAARHYAQVLALVPGHPIATHFTGMLAWQRGDRAAAEPLLRASIAADPSVPDFHNNLALFVGQDGRHAEAIEGFRRVLAIDPQWHEAASNLGLACEDALDWPAAERAYREALSRAPAFAQGHQNLARLLLLLGRYEEGWEAYRWRLAARGAGPAPAANEPRLDANLEGRRLMVIGEQGIGDALFFLRFVPELARRGAVVGFSGDARLAPLLERTGHFALGARAAEAPIDPGCERILSGDLPWLLEAHDPAQFPPALPLSALPPRVEAMRARLGAAGPRPRIALTWRAGVAPTGTTRGQVKEFPLVGFGQALRGIGATWISLQREPAPGAREALAAAIGAPVHDFSAANADLEDMLALLSLVDGYAGPSNANTHLHAGLGRAQHVLVPDPPEWRWREVGGVSPWFPGSTVHRRDAAGDWTPAFAEVAALLRG